MGAVTPDDGEERRQERAAVGPGIGQDHAGEFLRLEQQGRAVYVGYIPHFDPTVTALSPDANRFTESETNAACGVSLTAKGDGFAGETPGSSCMVALRGASGKWTIEVEPGTIRVRETTTGETLRFRKEGK